MLDLEIQADILNLLRLLQKKLGLAIIFITHDLSVASSFCHRVIVLDRGRIAEEGPAEQIFHTPQSPLTKELVHSSPTMISPILAISYLRKIERIFRKSSGKGASKSISLFEIGCFIPRCTACKT